MLWIAVYSCVRRYLNGCGFFKIDGVKWLLNFIYYIINILQISFLCCDGWGLIYLSNEKKIHTHLVTSMYFHVCMYVCISICLSAYFHGVETAAYPLECTGCSLASLQHRLLFGCSFLLLTYELTTGHQSLCWTWKWPWGKSEYHKPDRWEVTRFAFSSAEVSYVLSFSPKFY